jgi:hypothetical protein
VIALALLVRPHWVVWVIALLVAASAVGAIFIYTYVDVGVLGPLPNMYEPTWALPGKRLTAVAEVAATSTAAVGLAVAVHARRSTRGSSVGSPHQGSPAARPVPGEPPGDSRMRRGACRHNADSAHPSMRGEGAQ